MPRDFGGVAVVDARPLPGDMGVCAENDAYQMGDAVLNYIMSSGLYAGVLKR
jgi:hypothetical protein